MRVHRGVTKQGDRMKSMIRRLLILAAPLVWRKIKERRNRGR
jgi:hypothetical protein